MRLVNLSVRLLIAFGCMAVLSTAVPGLLVRMEWRRTENERFDAQVRGASRGISLEVQAERQAVHDLLRPLCKHDAFVDRTLVDVEAGRLDGGRRLAIAQLVPEEMKALRLDELILVTDRGEVLGAGHDPSLVGVRRKDLAEALLSQPDAGAVRAPSQGDKPVVAALTGSCVASAGNRSVGLLGSRHIQPMLDRLSHAYGVRLALVGAHDAVIGPEEIAQHVEIDEAAELRLVIAKSRRELDRNLAMLDQWIVMTGGVTLGVAIILATFLARSLANPLSELVREVAEVVEGEPREIVPRGTSETRKFTVAFNKTLRDLVALRRRHAAVERIAAWREVARRVAHEIKNPLTPIRSSVETLRRLKQREDPKFDDYFQEATKGILEDVHRIASIASDFARFARIPAPRPTLVDMGELCATSVAMHGAQGIRVDLDAQACPSVRADKDQLGQVLTNLVQNALDAVGDAVGDAVSDAGRDWVGEPRVRVFVGPRGADHVCFGVEDNGAGVPAHMVPRLFEPYVTTKSHGTGLGLAIVQRIVLEHGGEIAYEAGHGGACFVVTIPCAGPSVTDRATPLDLGE